MTSQITSLAIFHFVCDGQPAGHPHFCFGESMGQPPRNWCPRRFIAYKF